MRAKGNDDLDQAEGIDKSVLVIATPRRYRNREHLRYVAHKRVSSAAANNPIRIISATCSRGRSAARPAMNSPSRSAARIIARSIAPATSGPGGRRPDRPVKVARQLWRQTRLNDPHDPQQPSLAVQPGNSTDRLGI
jgi:hypothetical protein